MKPVFSLVLPLSLAFGMPHAVVAQESAAAVDVASYAGKSLFGPKGERIGAIYKVVGAGVPQLIIDGKIRSVPNASLSVVDGKLTTSLTKKELTKR
jgi:hypothetical protein